MSDIPNRIKLDRPVVVEGKYDKIKLVPIIDAKIIVTDGFGVFKRGELVQLIRRVAAENGIFVLTDSDGGGLVIRNFFRSILPKEQVTHLYIPQIKGKEKRKSSPSKQGLLGVEGIDAEIIRSIFRQYESGAESGKEKSREITKLDLFSDGLAGGKESSKKRKQLAKLLSLPDNLSSNAMLEAINMLYTFEEYKEAVKKIEDI